MRNIFNLIILISLSFHISASVDLSRCTVLCGMNYGLGDWNDSIEKCYNWPNHNYWVEDITYSPSGHHRVLYMNYYCPQITCESPATWDRVTLQCVTPPTNCSIDQTWDVDAQVCVNKCGDNQTFIEASLSCANNCPAGQRLNTVLLGTAWVTECVEDVGGGNQDSCPAGQGKNEHGQCAICLTGIDNGGRCNLPETQCPIGTSPVPGAMLNGSPICRADSPCDSGNPAMINGFLTCVDDDPNAECPEGQSLGFVNGERGCYGQANVECPQGQSWGSVNGVSGCYGSNNSQCPDGQSWGTVNGVSGCYGSGSSSSSGSSSGNGGDGGSGGDGGNGGDGADGDDGDNTETDDGQFDSDSLPDVSGAKPLGQLINEFSGALVRTEVVSSLISFFRADVNGSCPVWVADVGLFVMRIDQFCSPIIPWNIISSVMLFLSSFFACRVAFGGGR